VTGKLTIAPEQPLELVSITLILPLLVLKLTVMVLFSGPVAPDTIVAPSGTIHVYVEPGVRVTLYTIPVASQAGLELPDMAGVEGRSLIVITAVPVTLLSHAVVLASRTLTSSQVKIPATDVGTETVAVLPVETTVCSLPLFIV
jgi:hypothetical protein